MNYETLAIADVIVSNEKLYSYQPILTEPENDGFIRVANIFNAMTHVHIDFCRSATREESDYYWKKRQEKKVSKYFYISHVS